MVMWARFSLIAKAVWLPKIRFLVRFDGAVWESGCEVFRKLLLCLPDGVSSLWVIILVHHPRS